MLQNEQHGPINSCGNQSDELNFSYMTQEVCDNKHQILQCLIPFWCHENASAGHHHVPAELYRCSNSLVRAIESGDLNILTHAVVDTPVSLSCFLEEVLGREQQPPSVPTTTCPRVMASGTSPASFSLLTLALSLPLTVSHCTLIERWTVPL